MKLHVLTACTRPENLPRIAASLQKWGPVDFTWHIRFDWAKRHVGGQALKNAMLDEIEDGWVWVLDDDTVANGKLYRRVQQVMDGVGAVVVSQRHSILGILHAKPENVKVSSIDIGQAVISREVIGSHRIPETYAGDGEFLSAVLGKTEVVYLDEVLSFHNALS